MKLTTLVTLGAAGMAATAATVWLSVDAPRPHTASAAAGSTGPTIAEPAKPPPAQPVVDKSHFTAGKTLLAEGRLGHAVLPADVDSETFLFVDVSTDLTARAAAQVPLNLSIVIDHSGSMKGKRLQNAVAATRNAIEHLRDGDVVSVITYNSRADVLVSPTVLDAAAKARILRQLTSPAATGETCISCGLDAGMRLLGQRTGMVNRVLLLSDGFATEGVRDLPGMRRIAEDARRLGASITTIGVDVSYDEKIMAALARDSNGSHFFAQDPSSLPAIFDREMETLTRTVANQTDLIVDLAPGVFVDHVYDRVSVGGGSQVVVPLGAFATGDHKTALLRLRVPRGPAGERPIAAVRLRYDDLATGKPGQCEGQLVARASTDPAEVTPLDGIVSARVSSSETAEALEEANALFRAGKTRDATNVLQQQQMNMEHMHMMAKRSTDPMRMNELDDAFDRQKAALGASTKGFEPATPTAAAPAPGDKPAEAQMRTNQAGAFDLAQ